MRSTQALAFDGRITRNIIPRFKETRDRFKLDTYMYNDYYLRYFCKGLAINTIIRDLNLN